MLTVSSVNLTFSRLILAYSLGFWPSIISSECCRETAEPHGWKKPFWIQDHCWLKHCVVSPIRFYCRSLGDRLTRAKWTSLRVRNFIALSHGIEQSLRLILHSPHALDNGAPWGSRFVDLCKARSKHFNLFWFSPCSNNWTLWTRIYLWGMSYRGIFPKYCTKTMNTTEPKHQ